MKMKLGELRRLIREFGVDDTLRHQAGLFMAGGVSSNVTDREAILNPPPGLGSPEEEREEDYKEDERQKKSQAGVRVDDRLGGRAAGSPRVGGED